MFRTVRSVARVARVALPMRAMGARPIGLQLNSAVRLYSSDAAQSELVAALRSELQIEKENNADEAARDDEYFGSFLKDNGFKLVATPGHEEVYIEKAANNEVVKVFFNVSDSVAEPLEEVEEEEEEFDSPVRLNVVVERANGAIGIEAFIQDSSIVVESVTPYESAALAVDESPEADYKRRLVYQGPPFTTLDPSVQSAVQGFLESRSINSDLALFISEFSSYRENQEYVNWLNRLAEILE